jgi:hypothetical protein
VLLSRDVIFTYHFFGRALHPLKPPPHPSLIDFMNQIPIKDSFL